MNELLQKIREILIQGQQLSMQGSLDRRMPDKKAISYLIEARKKLKQYVQENTDDAEGWHLYSLAEETLLNYDMALHALRKAVNLKGNAHKKDLKKLALMQEYAQEWNKLQLLPKELQILGSFLDNALGNSPCDHSLQHTKHWLKSNQKKHFLKIIKALQNQGGCCDCEVLANVIKD